MTLTGRTEIWSAVIDSIAKRPLLGYGYDAFWLGLEGESYRIILAVSWALAQAQNGFLDVMLEMGVAGLAIVLLIFGFAFRDALVCLLRSRDDAQLRAVEWYLAIVILTLIYNLDESFLFAAKHLGSMIFLAGLRGAQDGVDASAAHCVLAAPAPHRSKDGAQRLELCLRRAQKDQRTSYIGWLAGALYWISPDEPFPGFVYCSRAGSTAPLAEQPRRGGRRVILCDQRAADLLPAT